MFLNSHNLNGVISVLNYSWQYLLTELIICSNLLLILCHTNVTLINQQWRSLCLKGLFLPYIWLSRCPYLCREDFTCFILNNTLCPSRDALTFSTVPMYTHLIVLTMLHSVMWEHKFPITSTLNLVTLIGFLLIPTIEITNKINLSSVRSPFTKYPSVSCLMQTIVVMAVCKIRECQLTILCELIHLPKSMLVTSTNCILIRSQIGIILYKAYVRRLLHFCRFSRSLFDWSLLCCGLLCNHGR